MKGLFLDTSGWFAALSPKEAKHKAARAAYVKQLETGSAIVTTNVVVAEMQVLLSRFRGPAEGIRFLDSLYQDATHVIVFVDRDRERAAIDRWLRRFDDQRLSLTDAVSFEVMREYGLRTALAIDGHFSVAGFETVP